MPGSARIAVAVCAVAVAGSAFWFAQRQPASTVPAATPPAAPAPAPPAPQPAAPVTAVLPVETPQTAGVPEADCIAYPDGSRLPPLNGVTKAPPATFHKMQPFSKVVGRERDAFGTEWYVHENGLRTTTRLDRGQPVFEASMPSAPKPLIDR